MLIGAKLAIYYLVETRLITKGKAVGAWSGCYFHDSSALEQVITTS